LQNVENQNAWPIRGWLILWAIGLCTTSLFSGLWFFVMIDELLKYDFQYEVQMYGDLSANFFQNLIVFQVFSAGFLAIGSLVCHYYFWNRRKEFIMVYVVYGLINIVIAFVDDLLINVYQYQLYTYTLGSIISCIIWFTYVAKSVRVKHTFVNRKKQYIKLSKEEYDTLKNSSN
jgi:hypothetical protein